MITFIELKQIGLCQNRYVHLSRALGGVEIYGKETPITYAQILEHNGLADVIWILGNKNTKQSQFVLRLFAIGCAFNVLQYFENKYPNNKNPRNNIIAAHLFSYGEITEEKLNKTYDIKIPLGNKWDRLWIAAKSAAQAAQAARNCIFAWVEAQKAAEMAQQAVWFAEPETRALSWEAERKFQYKFLKILLEEYDT